jgi:hypothetical protein
MPPTELVTSTNRDSVFSSGAFRHDGSEREMVCGLLPWGRASGAAAKQSRMSRYFLGVGTFSLTGKARGSVRTGHFRPPNSVLPRARESLRFSLSGRAASIVAQCALAAVYSAVNQRSFQSRKSVRESSRPCGRTGVFRLRGATRGDCRKRRVCGGCLSYPTLLPRIPSGMLSFAQND